MVRETHLILAFLLPLYAVACICAGVAIAQTANQRDFTITAIEKMQVEFKWRLRMQPIGLSLVQIELKDGQRAEFTTRGGWECFVVVQDGKRWQGSLLDSRRLECFLGDGPSAATVLFCGVRTAPSIQWENRAEVLLRATRKDEGILIVLECAMHVIGNEQ